MCERAGLAADAGDPAQQGLCPDEAAPVASGKLGSR